MRRFLESNPGLKSRFDRVFGFEDFNHEELMSIALNQLTEMQLKPDKGAKTKLSDLIQELIESKDQYFGNGRSVRKVVEEAVRQQHIRLSAMPHDKRSSKMIQTLTSADLKSITVSDKTTPDIIPAIGFKRSS
jgi:hypothetical protein